MNKSLPINMNDFKSVVEKKYYVDKTNLIKELLDNDAKINVFSRPSGFGKTLNLSMIKYFFEDRSRFGVSQKEFSFLFEGKNISNNRSVEQQGKYPVVSLSFKKGNGTNFDDCLNTVIKTISSEFERHNYVLDGGCLTDDYKVLFKQFMNGEADRGTYKKSLRYLCKWLEKEYKSKVIVLIDDYDVPLQAAYYHGFHKNMNDYFLELFEEMLKDNTLRLAVITGCFNTVGTIHFTELGNTYVNSALSVESEENFGFVESDVWQLCEAYDLVDKYEQMSAWYGGYRFGNSTILNPKSCIGYVSDYVKEKKDCLNFYLKNDGVKIFLEKVINLNDSHLSFEIEKLVKGSTVKVQAYEDITYDEMDDNIDKIMNIMCCAGLVVKVSEDLDMVQKRITIQITNIETKLFFQKTIWECYIKKVDNMDRKQLDSCIVMKDVEGIKRHLQELLLQTIKFCDEDKRFYYQFLQQILNGMDGYNVRNDSEEIDICLVYPRDKEKKAFVWGIGIAPSMQQLEQTAKSVFEKIENKGCEDKLRDYGCLEIVKYSIAFYDKNCLIYSGENGKKWGYYIENGEQSMSGELEHYVLRQNIYSDKQEDIETKDQYYRLKQEKIEEGDWLFIPSIGCLGDTREECEQEAEEWAEKGVHLVVIDQSLTVQSLSEKSLFINPQSIPNILRYPESKTDNNMESISERKVWVEENKKIKIVSDKFLCKCNIFDFIREYCKVIQNRYQDKRLLQKDIKSSDIKRLEDDLLALFDDFKAKDDKKRKYAIRYLRDDYEIVIGVYNEVRTIDWRALNIWEYMVEILFSRNILMDKQVRMECFDWLNNLLMIYRNELVLYYIRGKFDSRYNGKAIKVSSEVLKELAFHTRKQCLDFWENFFYRFCNMDNKEEWRKEIKKNGLGIGDSILIEKLNSIDNNINNNSIMRDKFWEYLYPIEKKDIDTWIEKGDNKSNFEKICNKYLQMKDEMVSSHKNWSEKFYQSNIITYLLSSLLDSEYLENDRKEYYCRITYLRIYTRLKYETERKRKSYNLELEKLYILKDFLNIVKVPDDMNEVNDIVCTLLEISVDSYEFICDHYQILGAFDKLVEDTIKRKKNRLKNNRDL